MPAASIRSIPAATPCSASAPGRRSRRCRKSPDHAYIVTPTDAAVEAVAECGRLGVKVATVLADGFTEAGERGDMRVARLRDICATHRHPRRRPVEPRHRRPAHEARCSPPTPPSTRRSLPVGPHLRGLAFRQHDRRAAVARQGARHRLRRPRLGRQRGRSFARRDLRRSRSMIPASTATCCSSKPCATPTRCAASRSRRPSAASRSSPTSSAARRRRASLRSRTPARSPARTTWPTRSSPIAGSRASIRSTG